MTPRDEADAAVGARRHGSVSASGGASAGADVDGAPVGDAPGAGRAAGPASASTADPSLDRPDAAAPPSGAPTRFGAGVALAVVVAGTLLAAAGVGDPLAGLLAAVGGGLVGGGAVAAGRDRNRARAAGSLALVAGLLVGVGALALADAPGVVAAGGVAVAAVGLAGAREPDADPALAAFGSVTRALAVTLAVGVGVALVHNRAFRTAADALAARVGALLARSDLVRFVALQAEAVLAAALLALALPVLDEWTSGDGSPGGRDRDRPVLGSREVPRASLALLAAQAGLAATAWGTALFDRFLASLGSLGAVVSLVLRSGAIHLALAGVCGVLAAVLAVDWLRDRTREALDVVRPSDVALAAGGLVPVAGLAVVALPPVGDAVAGALAAPDTAPLAATFGAGGALLLGAAAALFAGLVGWIAASEGGGLVVGLLVKLAGASAGDDAGRTGPNDDPGPRVAARGVALGAAALVLAGVLAATAGASALVVFAVVAAGLVVHDVGRHAAVLGALVGRDADTAGPESVHAVGSLLVAAVGVAAAAGAAFVVGPVPTVDASRALAALVASLVALLAFAYALAE